MDFETILDIEDYIERRFGSEDENLRQVRGSMAANGVPMHNIYPNQAKLLQILARAIHARRILEIGTLAGYSTIYLARALPESGRLITIELEERFADLAENNFASAGVADRIELRRGEALSVLASLSDEGAEPFDFVFFDAHKPSYTSYFDWAIRHTHPGSMIVADNVLRDGAVLDASSTDERVAGVQRYNDVLADRTNADRIYANRRDIETIIVPNVSGNGYDGMAISLVL